MASKSKSKLPSDWKAHMFSDDTSDEDDDGYNYIFDNFASDDGAEERERVSQAQHGILTQPPQTAGIPVRGFGTDSVQSTDPHSESGEHTAGYDDHVPLPLKGQSPTMNAHVVSVCRGPQVTSGQPGQEMSQYGGVLHETEGQDEDMGRQSFLGDVSEAVVERPAPYSQSPPGHGAGLAAYRDGPQHPPGRSPVASAGSSSPQTTPQKPRRLVMKRQSDWDLDEQVRGFVLGSPTVSSIQLGGSGTPASSTLTKHTHSQRRRTESELGLWLHTAESDNSRTARPREVFRRLSVQSLGVNARETPQYLPADSTAEAATRGEKTKTKGWDKLRFMLRRKSKDNCLAVSPQDSERTHEGTMKSKKTKVESLLSRGLSKSKLESVNEDVYTVAGQVLPIDGIAEEERTPTKKDSRRTKAISIPLTRRNKDTSPLPSTHGPLLSSSFPSPSSDSILIRSPSPLMQEMVDKFGAFSDDTASDSSSVTSDSLSSTEIGGGSGRLGGGKEEKGGRGTVVERGGGGTHYGSYQDVDSQLSEISIEPLSSGTSERSAVRSMNEASGSGVLSFDGPYGKMFTAKLFNRQGKKGVLSNVTHVSHVYRGTLLVTDLLGGKLLHMARSGRVLKSFEVEPGSEPWCACVTPHGYVAVTLRRPACVTVWSGSGSLVREFGHDVLQSPTGLACDRQGRFIVADERTNRVALFSPDGNFMRYLAATASPKPDNGHPLSSSSEKSSSLREDGSSMNDGKENTTTTITTTTTTTKGEGSVSAVKTKKRVRMNLDDCEIRVVDPDGGILKEKEGDRTQESAGKAETSDADAAPSSPGFSAAGNQYVFHLPRYVCVSPSGHIIVSDSASNSVKVFTPEGVYVHSIGSSGSQDGQLKVPYGVCCDPSDNVYVADHYNDRVSVFSLRGEFLQHALTAVSGLCRPKSVAIRPAHVRKLFVAHGGLRATEVLVYRLESTPRYISFKCDL